MIDADGKAQNGGHDRSSPSSFRRKVESSPII